MNQIFYWEKPSFLNDSYQCGAAVIAAPNLDAALVKLLFKCSNLGINLSKINEEELRNSVVILDLEKGFELVYHSYTD